MDMIKGLVCTTQLNRGISAQNDHCWSRKRTVHLLSSMSSEEEGDGGIGAGVGGTFYNQLLKIVLKTLK